MMQHDLKRGFTLLEALIYLALFGLLIGGAVIAAYNLFESSSRGQAHAMLQEEGDFILAKISWALSGSQAVTLPSINTPPCSSVSSTLAVSKYDASTGLVTITLSGGNSIITEGGGTALPLNNANVTVTKLSFLHCYNGGLNPESVEASTTLTTRLPNGMLISQNFSSTGYLQR